MLQFFDDIDNHTIEKLRVSGPTRRVLQEAFCIPLQDQGGYRTGKVRETDVLGIDCPPIEGKPGDLSTIINFANTFWDLFRQGIFWGAKRVDGHSDLGGFVLYLKPADIKVRTVFFPHNPEQTFPIASEGEAAAFGGHDPFTGCKHYDGMNGTKAGMLASDLIEFWSTWDFETFFDFPHFQGFFDKIRQTGRMSILGDAIYRDEAATSGESDLSVLRKTRNILRKIWNPTARFMMPEATACRYVGL